MRVFLSAFTEVFRYHCSTRQSEKRGKWGGARCSFLVMPSGFVGVDRTCTFSVRWRSAQIMQKVFALPAEH